MSLLKNIVVGEKVFVNGNWYEITNLLNLEACLGKDLETGKNERLYYKDINFTELESENDKSDIKTNKVEELSLIEQKDWNEALRRFSYVKPLIENNYRTKNDVAIQAKQAGVSIPTMYRWISIYQTVGKLSALLPTKRDGGKNKSRLSIECETIIEKVIVDHYLTTQRKRVDKIINEVKLQCRNANVKAPHPNTIRNRINDLNEKDKTKKRFGKKAVEKFIPSLNKFPEGNFPLDVIQIDHTPLDIILVDEVYRQSIGRPWITLAVDIYSRMVAGLYISFDPPGALSTGMCISNAIIPKDNLLSKLGIQTSWNIWGLPRKIHADNAKEFRGEMLRRSCQQYDIDLEWRPVATPKYGGHIERLLGTILREIHSLPGTTFSNTKERSEYNSEKKAVFTLPEFEKWLITFIVEVYHQRLHTSLKTSPAKKFEQGIFGVGDSPGTGIPPRIIDEDKLKIDFMPMVERTIQRYGVVIDDIHYYHDVLRPHINSFEDDEKRKYRKFIFRRDPRDISVIYFYDPDLNRYFSIPYRNVVHPAISLWELRSIRKKLKDEGYQELNEDLIFDAYHRMEMIKEKAQKTTKRVRRERTQKKYQIEVEKPYQSQVAKTNINTTSEDLAHNNFEVEGKTLENIDSDQIYEFDDYEEYD